MKSNEEWKRWGKHDPLFAVSSWEGKSKDGPAPWTDEEFYELGRQDWQDFAAGWRSFEALSGHCLEIGCGAGRITRQLAGQFEQVTAVDVSEDQIAYARRRLELPNVNFQVTQGVALPLEPATIDAVFSCHVFQHFDSLDDTRAVFAELARVMKPGATLCIHLPIFVLPDARIAPLLRGVFQAWASLNAARARLQRRAGKLIMRGLLYERPWLVETLEPLGFADLEFRGFRTASNGSWHDVVLARKSP